MWLDPCGHAYMTDTLCTRCQGQVTAFAEKPERETLDQMAHASMYSTAEEPFEASMGIYVFRREVLRHLPPRFT